MGIASIFGSAVYYESFQIHTINDRQADIVQLIDMPVTKVFSTAHTPE